MSLEHHNSPRFTLTQRDEILNLAARLQVQHEATVGVDELFAEAVASGIDPRFVHEATMRLGRKSRSFSLPSPLFAFILFTLQACLLMLFQFSSWSGGAQSLQWPRLTFAGGVALLLALMAARKPLTRRFVPLAPLAVWASVAFLAFGITKMFPGPTGSGWAFPSAFAFGSAQFVASLIAVYAVKVVREAPQNARTFRLYRGQKV